MPLQLLRVVAVADDLQQVLVAHEVEAREELPLTLQERAQRLLHLRQLLRQPLQRTLDVGRAEHVQHARLHRHLAHGAHELRVDRLEARVVLRQLLHDVRTAHEDALQVHPAPLHVDPHVEQHAHARQLVAPALRLLREHAVVRRLLHALQRRDVLVQLLKQLLPPANQLAPLPVRHQLQRVPAPELAHLSQVLLQRLLALRRRQHLRDLLLLLVERRCPEVAHAQKLHGGVHAQRAQHHAPVPLLQRRALQLRQQLEVLLVAADRALQRREARVLLDARRHGLQLALHRRQLLARCLRHEHRPHRVAQRRHARPERLDALPRLLQPRQLRQHQLQRVLQVYVQPQRVATLVHARPLLAQRVRPLAEAPQHLQRRFHRHVALQRLLLLPLRLRLLDRRLQLRVLRHHALLQLLLRRLDRLLPPRHDLLQARPVVLHLLAVHPLCGEREALLLQQALARQQLVALCLPQRQAVRHLARRQDQVDRLGGGGVDGQLLQRAARLAHLLHERLRLREDERREGRQQVLVQRVVAQRHRRLDLLQVDVDAAYHLLRARRVQLALRARQARQQLLPQPHVAAQLLAHLLRVQPPHRLVAQPRPHEAAHIRHQRLHRVQRLQQQARRDQVRHAAEPLLARLLPRRQQVRQRVQTRQRRDGAHHRQKAVQPPLLALRHRRVHHQRAAHHADQVHAVQPQHRAVHLRLLRRLQLLADRLLLLQHVRRLLAQPSPERHQPGAQRAAGALHQRRLHLLVQRLDEGGQPHASQTAQRVQRVLHPLQQRREGLGRVGAARHLQLQLAHQQHLYGDLVHLLLQRVGGLRELRDEVAQLRVLPGELLLHALAQQLAHRRVVRRRQTQHLAVRLAHHALVHQQRAAHRRHVAVAALGRVALHAQADGRVHVQALQRPHLLEQRQIVLVIVHLRLTARS